MSWGTAPSTGKWLTLLLLNAPTVIPIENSSCLAPVPSSLPLKQIKTPPVIYSAQSPLIPTLRTSCKRKTEPKAAGFLEEKFGKQSTFFERQRRRGLFRTKGSPTVSTFSSYTTVEKLHFSHFPSFESTPDLSSSPRQHVTTHPNRWQFPLQGGIQCM